MNKVLYIVGQTATGKTRLALQLTEVFPAELISADSRQVYQGMNIGTGKDIPAEFERKLSQHTFRKSKRISYYTNKKTSIWLLDQVCPDENWSVSHFVSSAQTVIQHLWNKGKLPIVVGGTGLYLQSLFQKPKTISIPQNSKLRNLISKYSIKQLQKTVQELDRNKFLSMNHSDQLNPRRLIRAIEIGIYTQNNKSFHEQRNIQQQALWIGLNKPLALIKDAIQHRVVERMKQGMEKETAALICQYSDWMLPAFSATGYKEVASYLQGKKTKKQAVEQWVNREVQYAKRQATWFKKQHYIHWFDSTNKNLEKIVVNHAKTWYDT